MKELTPSLLHLAQGRHHRKPEDWVSHLLNLRSKNLFGKHIDSKIVKVVGE